MANQTTKIQLQAEISASSNGLISALKQASGAINDTTQSWSSKFSQLKDSTSLISQSVKNLGDVISKVDSADDFAHLSSSLNEVQTVFAKVQSEVSSFAQQMATLKNSASNLGMPVEEYQQFAEAVKNAGLSMEQGESMIKSMQERILALANGVPDAVAQFDKLGISIEQLSSNTVMGNFASISDAISTVIPTTERAAQAMDIFKTSVDQATIISDQYNKVIANGGDTFVTDKDVQNAISLSSAITKLGDQIGKYANNTKEAETDTKDFIWKLQELQDVTNLEEKLLKSLLLALDKHNISLESTRENVSSVADAYKNLADDIRYAQNTIGNKDEDEFTYVDQDKLQTIEQKIFKFRERLGKEFELIRDIMTQRINAGAPIDTKEMDDAIDHFNQLSKAMQDMGAIYANLGYSGNEQLWDLYKDEMAELLDVISNVKNKAEELNFGFGLDEATAQLDALITKFNEAKQEMSKGKIMPFDTKELEDLLRKLDDLGKITPLNSEAVRQLSVAKAWAGELKSNIAQYNDEVAKGYPIWQPVTNAINTTVDAVKKGVSGIRDWWSHGHKMGSLWDSIKSKIRSAGSYMTHFRNSTAQTNGQLKNTAAFLGKSVMQIMGMGSAVAVVAKAWQNVTALVKEYVKQLQEAEKAKLYGNAGEGADDMTRVREKRDAEMDKMMGKLKEFADLYDAEKAGSGEARAKRKNLQDELKGLYGFEFKEVRGEFVNLDKQIADQLEKLRQKRLKAVDAQIKANDKVRDGVDEYINSFGYWKKLGHTFTGDLNGNSAIKEAQERATRASNENMALSDQRRVLEKTDFKGEWQRLRQGKAQDEQSKAYEAQKKALDSATEKLNEWSNSLNDTDRQKNLRTIMQKYEEAVKGGVKEEEARKVAIGAINAMLKKEKEDETKKNQELLKAMEEKIKQYREAYKTYAEAQKAVSDAQKEYARTQRELAQENRSERISKRRERLAKKMGSFGFTPFAGFKMDEKPSERRERRRNAQIDASIAEKMAKAESGKRVTWTHSEKERLAEFQKLQKKDKSLEAAQKQMDAAEKQRKAADALNEAAKAIRSAVLGRNDAGKTLKEAGKDLREASSKRRTVSTNKSAEEIFKGARKGLTAKGIGTAMGQRQVSYNGQLDTLHKDLQDLNKRIYVVK